MRLLFGMTITAALLFDGVAMAQSAGEMLKTFGLIGAWSPDCSQNPKDALPKKPLPQYPVRWIYSEGDSSVPKLTRMIHGLGALVTEDYEIKTAEMISPNKIRYFQVPTTVQFAAQAGAQAARPAKEKPSTVIVEKSGYRIRLLRQIAADGTVKVEDGVSIVHSAGRRNSVRIPNPWFARCSN
jgi:hypothetical protein